MTQPQPKTYGLMVLYLSGDNDYGALHASNYGMEKLIAAALGHKSNGASDDETSGEFNCDNEVFEFSSEQDRATAMRFAADMKRHVLDYDAGKHTNAHWHALSDDELQRYKFGPWSAGSSGSEEEDDDINKC